MAVDGHRHGADGLQQVPKARWWFFFALAANPRQLLRPALYSSGAVALLLLVPHLVWQYHHDWASFAYHLSGPQLGLQTRLRRRIPGQLMLVVFNPFFVPLYVQAWRKVKPQTPVGRALKLLPVALHRLSSCSRRCAVASSPSG